MNKNIKKRVKGALLVEAPEAPEVAEKVKLDEKHPDDCQCIDCSSKLFGTKIIKKRAKNNSNNTENMVKEIKASLEKDTPIEEEAPAKKTRWFVPENILAIVTAVGVTIACCKLVYLSLAGGNILDIVGSSVVCFVLYYVNSKIQVTYK